MARACNAHPRLAGVGFDDGKADLILAKVEGFDDQAVAPVDGQQIAGDDFLGREDASARLDRHTALRPVRHDDARLLRGMLRVLIQRDLARGHAQVGQRLGKDVEQLGQLHRRAQALADVRQAAALRLGLQHLIGLGALGHVAQKHPGLLEEIFSPAGLFGR